MSLPCTAENDFQPALPDRHVDLIYLCYPNNPTGAVMTRAALKRWVDYARAQDAVIVYDAAYEAYIRDPELPHSIYEVEGAREVAIESRSFSKNAGFTGLRMAYTVVPREVQGRTAAGNAVSLNQLWLRRQSTKSNGPPYVIQRAAAAVYTPEGPTRPTSGSARRRACRRGTSSTASWPRPTWWACRDPASARAGKATSG